jgi:glutamine---fructose-6-phosphate transaminase (isomerizing)
LLDLKQEILDIPRSLRETLEKGRPEFEALVRATRWGDGPLFVVGSGPSYPAGLTAQYAFESLLGWPVVVRPASEFEAYALAVLRPRSVLLVISHSARSEETLEVARACRSRGAVVLVLTCDPESALAQAADGVFLLRAGESVEPGVKMAVLAHATLGFIALSAARILKRHHPQLDALEQEFEKLPGQVDWVLNQLAGAAGALASEVSSCRRLSIIGAGFYHPVALQSSLMIKELLHVGAEGFGPSVYSYGPVAQVTREDVVAFVSGSRSRLKKEVHLAAARVKKAGAKIVSITDAGDRELSDRSDLAVLLPTLSEMVGATLSLVVFGQAACHRARSQQRSAGRSTPAAGRNRGQSAV